MLGATAALVVSWAVPAHARHDASAMEEVGLERTGQGTFSLDVDGADIRTVCKAIAEFSGRNIVVAEGVKASVTVSLHDVDWKDALRTILRGSSLDYADEGGILRVDVGGKLASEQVEREQARSKAQELVPLETRIIKLNYANAKELSGSLASSISRRGQIMVEARTNSIIVTDVSDNLDAVEKMAKTLDSTTPQIEITAKLVDVDAEALHNMGIEWTVAPSTAKFLDGANPGTIGEPAGPLPGGGTFHSNDHSVQGGSQQTTGLADAANKLTFGIFKDWASIEAQLQVLEQHRKANIISNPRITTVDNREAKILVGQKIPLIVNDVAGNPVSQLQTIGIQLKVTPHLTQDRRVMMDLHPEVSDLSSQSTVQGGVIINTSEADTRVMVDDGQTAVIGGLIRSNVSTVRKGVPILKDIPILGILFRSDNNVRQNRELIIFVTPKLVDATASNDDRGRESH
jgi:type IV pilus assembly protein PilQ